MVFLFVIFLERLVQQMGRERDAGGHDTQRNVLFGNLTEFPPILVDTLRARS